MTMTTPATPVHWATRAQGSERSDRPSETSRLVAYLHLTVQLISGDRQQFVQTDPDAAANILDQIRPERLFAQRHFILSGRGAATVIPTESVERVEVRTDPLPEWPYHPADIVGIDEIAEEEFLRVQRREPAPPIRVLGRIVPSAGTDMAILVRTRSGAANYLSVRRRRAPGAAPDVVAVAEVVAEAASWAVPTARRAVTPVTAEDAHHFLSHLFARPVLFGRTEGGDGLFLLNPANAVSFTLAPPPPGSVAGAWPMRSAAP
jgi:hypothetical protein